MSMSKKLNIFFVDKIKFRYESHSDDYTMIKYNLKEMNVCSDKYTFTPLRINYKDICIAATGMYFYIVFIVDMGSWYKSYNSTVFFQCVIYLISHLLQSTSIDCAVTMANVWELLLNFLLGVFMNSFRIQWSKTSGKYKKENLFVTIVSWPERRK